MTYREGYATGHLDVQPIGDDGEMYIVPGHDPMAGFYIAAYMNNEEAGALGDGVFEDWSARHIWVTTEEREVTPEEDSDLWEGEVYTFYRFWDGPVEGSQPYTAIGYWDAYRVGQAPKA